MSIRWFARCGMLGGLALCAFAVTADTLPAIWQTREVEFRFRSERQHFDCDEFAARLGRIVSSLGARLSAATELRCSDSLQSSIDGRLVIAIPVEATAQNIQQVRASISATDRLAARVNGRPDPTTRIRVFPAQWRKVNGSTPRLDAGDCELLRAVGRQLLPALSVRDPQIHANCAAHLVPRFSVVALLPVERSAVDPPNQSPALATQEPACIQRDAAARPSPCPVPIDDIADSEISPAG